MYAKIGGEERTDRNGSKTIMQNMNYYYDFSGQKFGYPLSLSINEFSRSVFSRQSSLEISYVLRGEYEAVTADFSCLLREREMVVIAPDEIHMICKRQGKEKESIILTIHIDFSRMTDAMAGDRKKGFQTVVCSEEKNKEFYRQLKQKMGELLSMLIEGKNDLYQMNVIMMELVFIASCQNFSVEDLPLHSDYHENYIKAIRYIDDHFNEELSLSDVADQLSFSLSYTSKLLKRYTGIPFVKYLAYVRVRASLEALLEGRNSIEQIAADCGMPNSKAYTAAFKELYGILPSTYRKRFQQNLKYSKGKNDQKMELDEKQKELLYPLIKESQELLYEEENFSIWKGEGEILCRVSQGNGLVKLETEPDGTLVIHILKDKK